jgi:alpha-galactosidase
LKDPGLYHIVDMFGEQDCCSSSSGAIHLVQKPHSVRMLKLIDESSPAVQPPFEIRPAAGAKAGETLTFSAAASSSEAPVLAYHWDFGDGSSMDGMAVQHAFTHAGEYGVAVTATGLDAITNLKTFTVSISGEVSTRFAPEEKLRAE